MLRKATAQSDHWCLSWSKFKVRFIQICELKKIKVWKEKIFLLFNRTGPDEHVEAVDKLQKSVKLLQKVRTFPLYSHSLPLVFELHTCCSPEEGLIQRMRVLTDTTLQIDFLTIIKCLGQTNLTLLRDMAVLIAQNFKNDPQRGNFFSLHK